MRKILNLIIFFLIALSSNSLADNHPINNLEFTYKCVGKTTEHVDASYKGTKQITYVGYEEFGDNFLAMEYDTIERDFIGISSTVIDLGSRYTQIGNIDNVYVWYSAFPNKMMLHNKLFIIEDGKIRLTQDYVPMPNLKFEKQYNKLINSFDGKSDDEVEKAIYDYTMKIHKYFTKKFKYSSPIKFEELFTNKLVARNEYECEEIN